jgi:ATP-dependent DNA helicase RecG
LVNIEFAVEYIRERVPVRYEINSLARDEYPEYPFKAYREAVVNAVIHFDYFLGDMIAIEKHENKIVINNKGELLFSEKEFGKKSESRNRLISDLLSRTEYMEKAGTSIKRMQSECLLNGNKINFYFSDSFWVKITSNSIGLIEKNNETTQETTQETTKNTTTILTHRSLYK